MEIKTTKQIILNDMNQFHTKWVKVDDVIKWLNTNTNRISIVTIYDVKRLIELSQSNPIPDGESKKLDVGSDKLSTPKRSHTGVGRDTFDKDLEEFKL